MRRLWLRLAKVMALVLVIRFRGLQRLAAWMAFEFFRLYPTLRRNCAWHGPLISRFWTSEKEIWLTIDDGPDARDTPEILDLLAHYKAKATFFVIGKRVDEHPAMVERMVSEGHTIGNHTYSHPVAWWWTLPGFGVRREIRRANEAIQRVSGTLPRYFRSPVGMTPGGVHRELDRSGQCLVGWSLDSGDGRGLGKDQVMRRISSQLAPGRILLMHEGGRFQHRVSTLAAVLNYLQKRGYRCVLPEEDSLY